MSDLHDCILFSIQEYFPNVIFFFYVLGDIEHLSSELPPTVLVRSHDDVTGFSDDVIRHLLLGVSGERSNMKVHRIKMQKAGVVHLSQ